MTSRVLRFLWSIAAIAVAAVSADGQSCSIYTPANYFASATCAKPGPDSPCPLGQPITFQIASSSAPLTCVSATWTLPDGTTVNTSGSESFTRTLSGGRYFVPAAITVGSITRTEGASVDIGRGYVGIRVDDQSIDEGESVTFTVSRTNADASTDVPWVAFSQTSTPVTPYIAPASGTLTLAAGQLSGKITITSVADSVFTGPSLGERGYSVKIGPPGGVLSNDYLTRFDFDTFSLREDDWSFFDFTQEPFVAGERAGVATIGVRRTGNLDQAVQMRYSSEGPGVAEVDEWLSFAVGETHKTFSIPVIDDSVWTGDRKARIELLNFSRGGKPADVPFPLQSTETDLIITEDEPPPTLTVTQVSLPELDSGTHSAVVTVRLSQPVKLKMSYHVLEGSAKYGADFEPFFRSDSLQFDGTRTEMTIGFHIRGDTAYEPDETFSLRLDNFSPPFPLPGDLTCCTILNDDPALTPASTQIERGRSTTFTVDVGLASATAVTLPVVASPASVVSLQPSVTLQPGQSRTSFDVTGVAAGSSTISVHLPDGRILTATLTVRPSGAAVFQPSRLLLQVGEEATVELHLDPADALAQSLPLTADHSGVAGVADHVLIPAGGAGKFVVHGLAVGTTLIRTTLPPAYGGGSVAMQVDITEAAVTPSLADIEPSIGPTRGGTPFRARGAFLAADCTIRFGNAPATALALASDGSLTGITPAHGRGAVDVTLACRASTFVLPDAFTYVVPKTRAVRR